MRRSVSALSSLGIVAVLVLAALWSPVQGAPTGTDRSAVGQVSPLTAGISDSASPASVADTTPPTISTFNVSNPLARDIQVTIESDEPLAEIEVPITGPVSITLVRSDFREETSDGSYIYTATYAASSDGEYTAELETAADDAGNDGAPNEQETLTLDTTPPTITNLTATNPSGQNLEVTFNSDEELTTLDVVIQGPETANLTRTDFAESADDDPYTYVATYDGSTDGEYTVTIDTVGDAAGNNDTSNYVNTVTVDTRAPNVSNFMASLTSDGNVTTSFGSDERLDLVRVVIDGPESTTLTTTEPTRTTDDGTYIYNTSYAPSLSGNYTATLAIARDAAGNDGAADQTETVTVDAEDPKISNYTVSNTTNGTVSVRFEASERLTSIDVSLRGAESVSLSASDFSERLNGSTYRYAAAYRVEDDGNYTVTLQRAADAAGNDGASGQNGSVVVETPPTLSNFTVSNPSDRTLQVSFDSDERLSSIEVTVAGPESALLRAANFTETGSNGTFTYTATDAVDSDGTYTATLERAIDGAGSDGANGQTAGVAVSTPDLTPPTVVTGSNRTVEVGESVSLDASASTDNVGIAAYEWDLDGDGTVDATGSTVTHSFTDAGTYTVTLTVTDEAGNEGADTLTVAVVAPVTTTPPSDTTTAQPTTAPPTPDTTTAQPTTAPGDTQTPTDDATTTPSGSGDGFTALVAVFAVLAMASLVVRRH